MAIISFWSQNKRETGQTLSLVALTTYMGIQHNYKILLVDACFADDTIENCFWNTEKDAALASKLNKGKVDIASGVEGVISAIISNKTSPEIITNFTRVVLKNRLDVLQKQKTHNRKEYEENLKMYPEVLKLANKYYDLVFVDLSKTLKRETTKTILDSSAVIMYTMPPNMKKIDYYIKLKSESQLFKKGNIIPVLTRSDSESKYNPKNSQKYIGEKVLVSVPYNTLLMEAASEAGVANMFLQLRLSKSSADKNTQFLNAVSDCGKQLIYKLQELQYKI